VDRFVIPLGNYLEPFQADDRWPWRSINGIFAREGGENARTAMPLKHYFVWAGGMLLCLMFVFEAYLPKVQPRNEADIDRTRLRIIASDRGIAPDTGTLAIDDAGGVASDLRVEPKAGSTTVAEVFARLEGGTSARSRHPRKSSSSNRSTRTRPAAPSSNRSSASLGLRGSIAETALSH